MGEISRRDFLVKGTAAGVGGFLALETLGACRPSEPPGAAPPALAEDVYAKFPMTFTERSVPTTCWIGKQDCGMVARVLTQKVNGRSMDRIVKLEGHPAHPRNRGTLCPKGFAQLQAVYDYNRVKTPLKRVNAKGRPGRFVQITWSEAMDLLKVQLLEARAKKTPVLWQKGRSKAKAFYDSAFVKALAAFGVPVAKVGHGSYCSDSGYRAAEYTLGYHGVIGPDLAHTRYLLSWGWGLTTSGGNKLCWLTWPQKLVAARAKGLKRVVCLDPSRRQTGPHADEWLPNRPGSDLAFFLGLANYLVSNTRAGFSKGLIDEAYLTRYTNAPFLVRPDGKFLRVKGKEQVWDSAAAKAVDFDTAGVKPALTGTLTVKDEKGASLTVKPAYQLYKDHLRPYTPDWADRTCGLPQLTTARIARELFENARIGATITVDGKTLPYRPVSMMAYHVAQQELGFPAVRAAINVFQLLGAIDVPGGIQVDFAPSKLYKNWSKLDTIKIKTNDLSFTLGGSKFFPISSSCPSFFHRAQLDPERYDVDEKTIPKKVIVHMADPVLSFTDTPIVKQAYAQFEHVTVISPWLSETADLYADLVLPAATLEKYEGPMSGKTADESATALRLPPIKPLWQSRGEIDIYMDLAEKVGFLTGASGYLAKVNAELKLKSNAVATNAKPSVRSIFDAWAKEQGLSGVDFFEKNGVTKTKKHAASAKYARASDYHGARHRLYGESLLGYRQAMIAAGVASVYYQDYAAFPTWRSPTMWGSVKSGFNLHLISHKQVEFKQSRASFVPMLAELSPRQGLVINPVTAAGLGIKDGDAVYVESHNAVTGERRTVKTRAVFSRVIRPDTVSMSHHYGLTTHPWARGQGPSPNYLFFAGEGYIQCTQDASFHVMVRVRKA